MAAEAQNLSREMILSAYLSRRVADTADKAACLSYRRSTLVESALQIRPFMQNKANFKIGKM